MIRAGQGKAVEGWVDKSALPCVSVGPSESSMQAQREF